MEKQLYANFRSAKIVEILKIEVNEGKGTEDDPIIRVVYLLSKNGELLAKLKDNKDRSFAGNDEMTII